MLFTDDTPPNKILAINPNIPLNEKEKSLILTFLNKKVENWLIQNGNTIFYLDNIIGTTYQDWHGTPIIHLWQYYYAFHKQQNPTHRHQSLAELTTQSTLNDLSQLLKHTLIVSDKSFLYRCDWANSYVLIQPICSLNG